MDAKDSPENSLHSDSTQSASSEAENDQYLEAPDWDPTRLPSPAVDGNQYLETPDWDNTDPAHPMHKFNRAQHLDDIIARTKFTLPPLPSSTPLYHPLSSGQPRSSGKPVSKNTSVQQSPAPPAAQPSSPPSMRFMFPSAPGNLTSSGSLPLNEQPLPAAAGSAGPQKSRTRKSLIIILFILLATFVIALIGSVVGIAMASRGNFSSAPSVAQGAAPTTGHANTTDQPTKSTISGQRSFEVGAHPLVTINGHTGDINVSAGDTGTVLVNAHKHGSVSSADAVLKYVQSKDAHGQDRIDVNTNGGNANIDFDVTMPPSAQVQIQMDGGSVVVAGLSGVTIDTFSGNLKLQNIQGPVDVQTENGDITARTLKGQVKMQTQNGSIRINTINGQLQALTHNGDVIVQKATLKGQSLLETSSGSVRVDGSLNPNGNYTLKTNRGDIGLTLPANTAFQLTAYTASGSISNGFGRYTAGIAPRPPLNLNIAGGGSITINQSLTR